MKHIKKIFKQAFGHHKNGTKILATFSKPDNASPIIFAHSFDNGSANFVEWVADVFDDVAVVDESTFINEGKKMPNSVICVKGVKKVDNRLIKRALKLHKKGKGIAIAVKGNTDALDYVYDPSFTVAHMEGFDLAVAQDEIKKFMKKMSKHLR